MALNGWNEGALRSECGGHLNGRFPNSIAQKRSGKNPPPFCRTKAAQLAFAEHQQARSTFSAGFLLLPVLSNI